VDPYSKETVDVPESINPRFSFTGKAHRKQPSSENYMGKEVVEFSKYLEESGRSDVSEVQKEASVFLSGMSDYIDRGESFNVPGLGSFVFMEKRGLKRPVFQASCYLKAAVNGKNPSYFTTGEIDSILKTLPVESVDLTELRGLFKKVSGNLRYSQEISLNTDKIKSLYPKNIYEIHNTLSVFRPLELSMIRSDAEYDDSLDLLSDSFKEISENKMFPFAAMTNYEDPDLFDYAVIRNVDREKENPDVSFLCFRDDEPLISPFRTDLVSFIKVMFLSYMFSGISGDRQLFLSRMGWEKVSKLLKRIVPGLDTDFYKRDRDTQQPEILAEFDRFIDI
jgi:hypothetical protein